MHDLAQFSGKSGLAVNMGRDIQIMQKSKDSKH
jgi:hypothetical protein